MNHERLYYGFGEYRSTKGLLPSFNPCMLILYRVRDPYVEAFLYRTGYLGEGCAGFQEIGNSGTGHKEKLITYEVKRKG